MQVLIDSRTSEHCVPIPAQAKEFIFTFFLFYYQHLWSLTGSNLVAQCSHNLPLCVDCKDDNMTTDNAPSQDRSALILYGTETGTSQDIAEEVGRCLERLHFHTDVTGLDNASLGHMSLYPSCITVFVVATTGQGDFPDNARKFWKSLLRRKLSPSTLTETDYAVVGLGDSSYPKFNWAARKLDKRLRQLGATSIIESCEADEQGDDSTDGAF